MNPFRRAWRWLKDGLRDVFMGGEPQRKPRRKPCACGHPWRNHRADGCWSATGCTCALDRKGQPGRKVLVRRETGT